VAASALLATGAAASPALETGAQSMGGAGVATPYNLSSYRHNPAHLASLNPSIKVGISLSAATQALANVDLWDDIDDGESAIRDFDRQSDNGTLAPEDATQLIAMLNSLDGDDGFARYDLTNSWVVPGKKLSWALRMSSYGEAYGLVTKDDEDDFHIERAARVNDGSFDPDTLGTTVTGGLLDVQELAFSMGGIGVVLPPDSLLSGWKKSYPSRIIRFGATFKLQQVTIHELDSPLSEFDLDDTDDDKVLTGNIDLGMHTALTPRLQLGITVRNLIPAEFESPTKAVTYKSEPQIVAGLAQRFDWGLIALEADALSQEGFGDIDGEQSGRFGITTAITPWLSWQGGYSIDLSGERGTSLSTGLAFGRHRGLRLELSGVKSSEDGLGLSAQLMYTF